MPVQPFHSHGSHWNSQPIEGDSVDESSGDGDGGGDAHGGEGHGQRGFDRAKAAWCRHCGTERIRQQEDECGLHRIGVASESHQCNPESQSGRDVEHQCAEDAEGQLLRVGQHVDETACVGLDDGQVLLRDDVP